jgi:hypothetical protein
MERDDDRVAAAPRDEQALNRVFEDHDSELLGWP